MLVMCQNATLWDMKHGLKFITYYVGKHIAALEMCRNQPLVRDKPPGALESVKLLYRVTLKHVKKYPQQIGNSLCWISFAFDIYVD